MYASFCILTKRNTVFWVVQNRVIHDFAVSRLLARLLCRDLITKRMVSLEL